MLEEWWNKAFALPAGSLGERADCSLNCRGPRFFGSWRSTLHMVRPYVVALTLQHRGFLSAKPTLPSQIMSHAAEPPEGRLLCPSALLHLGNRAAVDQALSRLARKGVLMRVCQGVYVRPVHTRLGLRPSTVDKALASLSALWGELAGSLAVMPAWTAEPVSAMVANG